MASARRRALGHRRLVRTVALVTAHEIEARIAPPLARMSTTAVPVLIVDDNAAKRLALKAVLQPLGYSIVEADSGLGALRCLMAQNYAVILLDVRMPIMDGFETAALIRKRQQSELTPIIFITAYRSDEIVTTDLYAQGAVDFIFAPVPPDELRAKVSVFANLYRKAEALAEQARDVQTAADRLRLLNHELTALARQDPLTGLGNRRAFGQDLDLLEARVARYSHRYCMAVLDVDHFKAYNDMYGHPAGDHILQAFATQLQAQVRAGDALYRFGGDEFLCVFPEQSLENGSLAVERMRAGLERLAIPHLGNPPGVVTFSAGLAMLDPGHTETATAVLQEADAALYRAKELGRNRVEHMTPHTP
jgi:diguanylate cyclase (GGDEF)-like protein